MSTADQVLLDALSLPAEARASLALELLTSLDPVREDDDVDQAWAAEISRRLESIRQGKSVLRDWDEALDSMRVSIMCRDPS
jgi:putative addiction module component (TIGR02574 family)